MKKIELDKNEKIPAPFTVPDGYFEKLNQEILDKTVEKQKVRSFSFDSGILIKVAASVLILVASVYLILDFNNDDTLTAESLLADVQPEEIINYLSENDISEFEILNEIDSDFTLDSAYTLDDLDLDDESFEEFIYDLDINENI